MSKELTTLEEFDISRKLQFPHTFQCKDLTQKASAATNILHKNTDELLLITPRGFSVDFIVAGLSFEQIEFLARKAPKEYKEEIFQFLTDESNIADILNIEKFLDENTAETTQLNQDRIRNILQYIKDNRIAFEF